MRYQCANGLKCAILVTVDLNSGKYQKSLCCIYFLNFLGLLNTYTLGGALAFRCTSFSLLHYFHVL